MRPRTIVRRVVPGAFAGLLAAVFATPSARADATAPAAAPCPAGALPGLEAQFARFARDAAGGDTGSRAGDDQTAQALRAARAGDLGRLVAAVVGGGRLAAPEEGESAWRVGLPSLARLPCDPATRARDRQVWTLTLVGYSAREVADVVAGHLERADVDRARALLMTGHPRDMVIRFLEARWRPGPEDAETAPRRASSVPPALGAALEGHVARLAQEHGLDPALVRAVVAAESGGDPSARSGAGAIGLMQLMPATAAALGVDPWDPLDNLRGGITYLAGLVRFYGNAALALIAYNAGPQHADEVRAGRAVPYRETRRYLELIEASYPLPRF